MITFIRSFCSRLFSSWSAKPAPSCVVIKDEFFSHLAEWEQAETLATANHVFFGLHMSQHPQAVVKLNQLLNRVRPARIIEIGTGNAGLSVLLALWCQLNGAQFHSYDKTPTGHVDILKQLAPESFKMGDALEDPAVIAEIHGLVASPGLTLLMCDAGKSLEANLYTPSMKVADIVMMHDFSPTHETFERDMKGKIWNWHEAWYARVAEVSARHNIVYTSYFNDVVWSCGWKDDVPIAK